MYIVPLTAGDSKIGLYFYRLFTTQPEVYEQMVRRDIVERSSGDGEGSDDDENENLAEAIQQQELEDALNELAIAELSD